jgi:DNA-binding Lrp family transcriptional regulator
MCREVTTMRENSWTFLTNHSHVLICLAQDPSLTMRDVADRVGITERAAARIIRELDEANVLTRLKEGRKNRYVVNLSAPLRHPVEAPHTVEELIHLIIRERNPSAGA